MPRALATDFLQSMRFHVNVMDSKTDSLGDYLQPDSDENLPWSGEKPQAGFTTVSTPEVTVEPAEYKEGGMIYPRKYPGNPSMSDISMQRGVARKDMAFYFWIKKVMEGGGEYRRNLQIKHYHRQGSLPRAGGALQTHSDLNLETPARIYTVEQAFPTRFKPASDLDATASEISLAEIDFAFESFSVREGDMGPDAEELGGE